MNIQLKNVTENDLDQIKVWRMDPEITKFMYTDPVLTKEKQLEWYQKKVKNNEHDKFWVLWCDGQRVGVVSLNNIDYTNKRSYWAYYIGNKEYLGKGLGKQIELNLLHYVFTKMNLNKLCCEVFCFNEVVIKIHERFGSKLEGTLRQHIYKNGQYFDIVTMGILKDEWIANESLHNKQVIEIED